MSWVSEVFRRVPVQARSEVKLERVVTAAQRIVVAEGAEAVTTTRLAKESDVAVGTIYRYFENREGVLNILVANELDELDRRLDAVGYSLGLSDWRERARRGADVMIDFAADPDLAYRTLMYTSTLTGEIAATNREHDLRMAHKLLADLPRITLDAMAPNPLSVIHMYLGILDKGMELGFSQPGPANDAVIEQMHRASLGFLESYFRH
jgi:AcrR family transcriptional regulator